MLRPAVAFALLLLPAIAAADEPAMPLQPPGQTSADLQLHDGKPREETRPWEVRLGVGVGAARMAMLGETHGGIGVTIDLDALRWFHHVGVGLYLTELIATPITRVMAEGSTRLATRDLGWEIEPELAVRRSAVVARRLIVGWKATASAGVVVAETSEGCGSPFSHHGCRHVLERSVEAGAAAGAGVFAHVGPLAVDLGARAQGDSAGDAALALQASAGASW